ncbi:MAG TPA: regulatory protein RecX [Albitalea sp.]|nr:regulatory protein RecX [Albitalea sp.]
MAGPPLSLKARALGLLAQREHSASELRRKLLRHAQRQQREPAGDDDAAGASMAYQVDELIVWLQANRYLSEERFVESRIHARAARYGNLRIRQELAQHGVALGADAALALRESELERALQVWQRKYGSPPADANERARQSRFLAQRGFSPEVIARVMRRAAQPD